MTSTTNQPRFIVVAKVGASHGLKGFCKLHTFVSDPDALLQKEVFMKRRGSWLSCAPFELSHRGDQFMIRFLDCTVPEQTPAYVNLELGVHEQALLPCGDDEFYWAELEGMTVVNKRNFPMGTVQYLFESGASDVMVIRGTKEHLVPFVDHFVISIDREKRKIIVDWDPSF